MEELGEHEFAFVSALPPALVSLTPFSSSISPSPRRLSSCYTHRSEPVKAKRQLAWVSLQGRLVGAEEATSVKTIDRHGVLRGQQAVAWEMFTPVQRVLVVAVVAAAAINSKKNQQIFYLQKEVQIRDQVLQSMQQKMDSLFREVKYFDDQLKAASAADVSIIKMMDGRCGPCQHHILPPNHALGYTLTEGLDGDEVLECKVPVANVVEPEERRMSDLSDWAPSVASSVDNQLETGAAIHHDIPKLSAFTRSSEIHGSKRIAELEDVIRRKNAIISNLRRDIMILKPKVMNLTRRPSILAANSNAKPLPFMADNVLYDMDSTTGPSSDSDNSPRKQIHTPVKIREIPVQNRKKTSAGSPKWDHLKSSTFTDQCRQKAPVMTTPLRDSSINRIPNSAPSMKSRHSSSEENRSRRRPPARSREVTAPKRWL